MKTTIKEITPQWASQILETRNPNNRKLSERFVDRLVRDIRANGWILTHQGIAFDENGDLIDGQHRLAAIARANKSVKAMITTGVPKSQRCNGIVLKTFEAIDSGKPRNVGQMIAMNGWANGNRVAAVVRAMANWATGVEQWIAMTTPQTEKILAKCGNSVDWAVRNSRVGLVKMTAGIRAPISFYHTVNPEAAASFLEKFTGLDGVRRNDPAYALATWVKNHPGENNTITSCKVACSALWHSDQGNSVEKLYSNDVASDWLLSKNKQLAAYISSIINL